MALGGAGAKGLVGLVLAAGAGRRMGGPKALLRLTPDAPTLVEVAVECLRNGGCRRVTVVVGAQGERVGELARSVGADVVTAAGWDEGMGASLRAGLTALAGRTAADGAPTRAAVVTLVDLPDLTEVVVARVLAQLDDGVGDPQTRLVRAAYDGVPGHPVVLGRDHWPRILEAAHGDVGARGVLDAVGTVLVECGDLASGRDIDRPSQV